MKAISITILAILLILPQTGLCQARSAKPPIHSEKYTFTAFVEGKEFFTEFTEIDVPETPSWNPKVDTPPIAINKAIEKSQKFLGKFITAPTMWDIESIKYTKVGKSKWVYEIAFYLDRHSAKDGLSASFTVILKMDGTFFEPKVRHSDKN